MFELRQWRLIETGVGTASWNMAVDEALLSEYREGDLPVLRIYGWENSLSLGRFSKIQGHVDRELLKQYSIPCVRRLSGGGILVHGGDLSYSLVMPRDTEKGVKESYRLICGFLIRLYRIMGYEASFACDIEHQLSQSDICLMGNEAYDILINGEKMGGNAQRHVRGHLLQHGSIPMSFDTHLWKPLFLVESGLEYAATLDKLGQKITYDELALLLKESFSKTFGTRFIDDTLTPSEEDKAKELMVIKYTQESWNIDAKTV
ncbi:MAG: lipoate--protein ligase family protein [Sulfuricurvum sp.]|uniref:lipoate--protein ligase family protein n=1 Tax=Sulfuricurvum sp. TaxID=2025608 RepID=UPI00262164A1|nr:lipoate--protein ligase family protein [Sulfuricurvum sp.]MDD5160599.1 lipoate--protein ligase family protein [Sulfuricurvum sp.]